LLRANLIALNLNKGSTRIGDGAGSWGPVHQRTGVADEGFSIHVGPDTNNTDLITMTPGATAIIVTLMNIGGTDGIIGIITIRIGVRII
jgi:hypothetical protein